VRYIKLGFGIPMWKCSALVARMNWRRNYQSGTKPVKNKPQRLVLKYGIIPLTLINWDEGPPGYAENPDYWNFLFK